MRKGGLGLKRKDVTVTQGRGTTDCDYEEALRAHLSVQVTSWMDTAPNGIVCVSSANFSCVGASRGSKEFLSWGFDLVCLRVCI